MIIIMMIGCTWFFVSLIFGVAIGRTLKSITEDYPEPVSGPAASSLADHLTQKTAA